jgi:Fur family ferric uptake transcriptional regulator
MASVKDQLQATLKQHGYSVTQARLGVFEALEDSEPISINKLINRLPAIDRASIYRIIALFEELGIVRRLQIGWKYKLELSETYNFHHHHIVCKTCGVIVPTREDTTIEAAIRAITNEYGFTPVEHQLEIQGICSQCQKTPAYSRG